MYCPTSGTGTSASESFYLFSATGLSTSALLKPASEPFVMKSRQTGFFCRAVAVSRRRRPGWPAPGPARRALLLCKAPVICVRSGPQDTCASAPAPPQVGTMTQVKCDAASLSLASRFSLSAGSLALNGKRFLNPGRNGPLYYSNAPSSVVGGTAGVPIPTTKMPLALGQLMSGSAINIWLPSPCRVDSSMGCEALQHAAAAALGSSSHAPCCS